MSKPLRKFIPTQACESKRSFIVVDEKRAEDGLRKLKAELEREMCAFVPAKYRRYVRLFVNIRKPPQESEAGWEYNPR
jgi:hypothetical protein